ncbi:hypothetical protein ACGFJ7_30965 [Actinoplanes sp. NPDC048988]|uniref:hypothetical protein n=1 Tax=Actinoplanes sp. NPDC048988 TaxID=3363901 RepID=UPI003724BFCE
MTYKALLVAYPACLRRKHGPELIETMLEMAGPGGAPARADRRRLVLDGLRERFRPPVHRPLARAAVVVSLLIGAALGAAAGSGLATLAYAPRPQPTTLGFTTGPTSDHYLWGENHLFPSADAKSLAPGANAGSLAPGANAELDAGSLAPGANAGSLTPGADAGQDAGSLALGANAGSQAGGSGARQAAERSRGAAGRRGVGDRAARRRGRLGRRSGQRPLRGRGQRRSSRRLSSRLGKHAAAAGSRSAPRQPARSQPSREAGCGGRLGWKRAVVGGSGSGLRWAAGWSATRVIREG